jgi:hypothetical protein
MSTSVRHSFLFISYDAGHAGAVTSEWVSDKLRVLAHWHQPIVLLTGTRSRVENTELVKVIKASSLSWIDFRSEIAESSVKLTKIPSLLIAFTFGRIFDSMFNRLAGAHSHGKWSWIFYAFPKALFNSFTKRIGVIFSTGGPSSAHFVALLVKMCRPKLKLFVELQDPFIGSEMVLTPRALGVMIRLERALVKRSTKVVYVTKTAASRSVERHAGAVDTRAICAIYPGAWDFSIDATKSGNDSGKITFIHSGTLYSNRNLDLFFRALDELRGDGNEAAKRVHVINQGNLAVANENDYRMREDFTELALADRYSSLKTAAHADFLLLVQHSDTRSEETIPYKTYDYLNIGVPVFGLTNNPELDRLIEANGGFSVNNRSLTDIKEVLSNALESYQMSNGIIKSSERLLIATQFSRILG